MLRLTLEAFALFFLLLSLAFILLVLLGFDPVAFLELSESKGIVHQRLVSGLLLLLDSEERVFSNL